MGKRPVDTILANGALITMDAERTYHPCGAIAIDKDKIIAVGTTDQICAAYTATTMLDLTGRALLPGFINGHTHSAMSFLRGSADAHSLHSWLTKSIRPTEEAIVDAEFVYWGTLLALLEMVRGGITTIVDMYWYPEQVARACEQLGMRAWVGANIAQDYHDFEIAQKFVTQWRPHTLITPAIAPHALTTVPYDLLMRVRDYTLEQELPLLMHVAETAQEVTTIIEQYGTNPISFLERTGMLNDNLTIAHGIHLTNPEIELLAQTGSGIIHCPTSNLKLASGIAPVIALLDAGCAVGIGTDGAASNNTLSIIAEIKLAILLQRYAEQNTHSANALTGLELATIRGAQAIHHDFAIGSLEPYKQADIIAIDITGLHQLPCYDPRSTIAFASTAQDVDFVMINGIIRVQQGILCYPQELIDEVRERTAHYATRIRTLTNSSSHLPHSFS